MVRGNKIFPIYFFSTR